MAVRNSWGVEAICWLWQSCPAGHLTGPRSGHLHPFSRQGNRSTRWTSLSTPTSATSLMRPPVALLPSQIQST
jgi:hypothetical protein